MKEENFKLFCELRGQEIEAWNDDINNIWKGILTGFSQCEETYRTPFEVDGDDWYKNVRPIKKPEIIPWTAETIPFPLAVRHRNWDKRNLAMVTNIYHDSISYRHQGFNNNVSFDTLLKDFETRDGQPCGEVVEDE